MNKSATQTRNEGDLKKIFFIATATEALLISALVLLFM